MYAASTDVQRAIEQAFNDYREQSGIPANQVVFDPTTNVFIENFMQQFTTIVKGVINT